MSLLACDPRFHSICLTPYQLHNTTEAWQQLAQYLEGTWSDNFLNYSVLLRENIANLNVTTVFVLSLNAGFLEKVWDNIKRHFDPLWIVNSALMGWIVILVTILFKCLTQHISLNKVILQVLIDLKNPDYRHFPWESDQSLDGRDPWDHHVGCSSSPPCVTCLWSDVSLRAGSQWWVRSWKTGQPKTGTVHYTRNPLR